MTKDALNNVTSSLSGKSDILMKKKILALGKNYTVMDTSQEPLCYVNLNMGSNIAGTLIAGNLGKWAGRTLQYTYVVQDANRQDALLIKKGPGAWSTNFSVLEEQSGEQIATISLKRSLIGGMEAQWYDPASDSVTMVTKGNVIRRQYSIVDHNQNEIGFVRHKIAAVRDTWNLKLEPSANILNAVVFATVLDFEKEM